MQLSKIELLKTKIKKKKRSNHAFDSIFLLNIETSLGKNIDFQAFIGSVF